MASRNGDSWSAKDTFSLRRLLLTTGLFEQDVESVIDNRLHNIFGKRTACICRSHAPTRCSVTTRRRQFRRRHEKWGRKREIWHECTHRPPSEPNEVLQYRCRTYHPYVDNQPISNAIEIRTILHPFFFDAEWPRVVPAWKLLFVFEMQHAAMSFGAIRFPQKLMDCVEHAKDSTTSKEIGWTINRSSNITYMIEQYVLNQEHRKNSTTSVVNQVGDNSGIRDDGGSSSVKNFNLKPLTHHAKISCQIEFWSVYLNGTTALTQSSKILPTHPSSFSNLHRNRAKLEKVQ